MAGKRGCDGGCELTKLLFAFTLENTEEPVERQQETRNSVWSTYSVLVPASSSPTTSSYARAQGRKVNDRIPLEFYMNLNIKRICIALSSCNLEGKSLEKLSQCHLVVRLGGGQATSNAIRLETEHLEITKLQGCLGGHHIFL